MKPDIFDFIDKHNLHDGVKEKVLSVFQQYIDKVIHFHKHLFARKRKSKAAIINLGPQVFYSSNMVLQVAQLMMIDCKRAVPLFIQHINIISPSDVVSQLMAAKNKCDYRYYLHLYLHSLFVSHPNDGKAFHDMQVCLCMHFQ